MTEHPERGASEPGLAGRFPRTEVLASGEPLTLRLLCAEDAERFGAFLGGLSEQTRSLWRPHPFDQATADAVCASIDHSDVLRILATVEDRGGEQIIAYYTLKRGVL